jgi:hypothetical protein
MLHMFSDVLDVCCKCFNYLDVCYECFILDVAKVDLLLHMLQ